MRVGGHLQAFLPAWAAITDDAFVLSVIRGGFSIELADLLPGGAVRLVPPRMSPRMNRGIAAEVNTLCLGGGGVVERTIDQPELCLSPVFLVPKRSGKFRMILNLKRINLHISPAHFRMETLGSILPLRPGDWTASIDLKDAYHHVPIAPASRDLLGFTVAKKHVPLQGSALRPQTHTAPVHKTGCVRGGLSQTARAEIVLLPGRFASGGRIPGLTVPTAALSSPDCAGLRLPNKLGEIGARAYAAPDLPRSRHRSAPPAGAAEPGPGEYDHGRRIAPPPPAAGLSQGLAPIPGVPGQPSRCAPGLPAAHASPADTSAQAL